MAMAVAGALACQMPAAASNDLLAQLTATSAMREVAVLEGVVNGQPLGLIFALVERGEAIALDAATLQRWRVRLPERLIDVDGRSFVALADLVGVKANIEPRTQRLLLEFPPELYTRMELRIADQRAIPVSAAPLAGFLNYTLFGFTASNDSYGSGFFEAGLSGSHGALTSTLAANTKPVSGNNTDRLIRYETAWRIDQPQRLTTLILGDAISYPGAWGRSVRFGGVQYGTNFALQPNLITYPLQAFSGTAVVPSTVDVFVNGQRIASQPVQPGPFTLNDVPLVSGAGDVQLVVRDVFGQQQVITQPFYASRRLLRAGLDDYNISVGAVRRDFGIESFDYGDAAAAGHWRRGFNDWLTAEARFEGDPETQAGGATIDVSLSEMTALAGIATLGAAFSSGNAGDGQMLLAGYEYQGRGYNFSARSNWATSEFRLVGDNGLAPLRQQSYVAGGINLGRAGSLGMAWASQRYVGAPTFENVTATYTASLAARAFLALSVSRSLSPTQQTSAFLTLSLPLDSRTTVAGEASATRASGQSTSYVGASVQRSLPTDEGYGYRLRATTQEQLDGSLGYTWRYGTYLLEASSFEGDTAARATISGGIGFIGGRAFMSRPIFESFGLVDVGGFEGVRVYHDGNPLGRTDRDGKLIVHRMTPYTENRITIEERDMPVDVSIRHREMRVVPPYRGGALAAYDAKRRFSVILVVVDASGKHLPAGTLLTLQGSDHQFVVGAGGEVYVPDLPAQALFETALAGSTCRFKVSAPASREILPVLGPFVCGAMQ